MSKDDLAFGGCTDVHIVDWDVGQPYLGPAGTRCCNGCLEGVTDVTLSLKVGGVVGDIMGGAEMGDGRVHVRCSYVAGGIGFRQLAI